MSVDLTLRLRVKALAAVVAMVRETIAQYTAAPAFRIARCEGLAHAMTPIQPIA